MTCNLTLEQKQIIADVVNQLGFCMPIVGGGLKYFMIDGEDITGIYLYGDVYEIATIYGSNMFDRKELKDILPPGPAKKVRPISNSLKCLAVGLLSGAVAAIAQLPVLANTPLYLPMTCPEPVCIPSPHMRPTPGARGEGLNIYWLNTQNKSLTVALTNGLIVVYISESASKQVAQNTCQDIANIQETPITHFDYDGSLARCAF